MLPTGEALATIDLLAQVRAGDAAAWKTLLDRYLVQLKGAGHGRLRGYARSMADTNDIVQDALLKAIHQVEHFESRHRGALLAYLRRAVRNCAIDEGRRSARRGAAMQLNRECACDTPSPLQQVLRKEEIGRYRAALRQLKTRDRRLIALRMQRRLTYDELASRLSLRSPDAARMATKRAFARLRAAFDTPLKSGPRSGS